jgi:hypothetical protein
MSPPRKHDDPAIESRITTAPKRRLHAQPFQFGLGSLFVLMAGAAVLSLAHPLWGLMGIGIAVALIGLLMIHTWIALTIALLEWLTKNR